MSGLPARTVVLRALGLGDLLVAVPALRLLRRAVPDHRLVLAAPGGLAPLVDRIEAVDALVGCAHVDDLGPRAGAAGSRPHVAADLHRPDLAVNLHGRGPQSHAALDTLAPRHRVGHAAPGWDGPAWSDDPTRPERRRWCDLLAATGLVTPGEAAAGGDDLDLPGRTGGGPVVVHPGAAFGSKRWPVERFTTVARELAGRGHRIVVTGGDGELARTASVVGHAGLPPAADLGGRTGLVDLLDLVAAATLVVAGDTGVAHVATAFATPSVTLFGPVGPEQWGPPRDGPHVTLTDPTLRRGDRFADDPDPALEVVSTAAVLRACERVLAP